MDFPLETCKPHPAGGWTEGRAALLALGETSEGRRCTKVRLTQHDGRRSRALDQEGLGECEWRDTCGSDVPPLDVVESLTWKGRIVSLGRGMEHALESPWLSQGVAALLAARGVALALRLGEGDSLPIRLGGMLLDIHDLVPQLEEALRLERLREEVGEVLVAADKRNTDLGFFDGRRSRALDQEGLDWESVNGGTRVVQTKIARGGQSNLRTREHILAGQRARTRRTGRRHTPRPHIR